MNIYLVKTILGSSFESPNQGLTFIDESHVGLGKVVCVAFKVYLGEKV